MCTFLRGQSAGNDDVVSHSRLGLSDRMSNVPLQEGPQIQVGAVKDLTTYIWAHLQIHNAHNTNKAFGLRLKSITDLA